MDGIYKQTQLGFKDEPKLSVTSSLDVLFYNLDINTATLDFEVTKNGYPLLLSENHVNAYVVFMSKTNNSIFTAQDLEIVDELNGILRATVPSDFLKAVSKPNSTTTALGQVYISVNGKDDTVVMSEFDFKVKDALINQMSSDIKVSYIRMFDDLYKEISDKAETYMQSLRNISDNYNTFNTIGTEVDLSTMNGINSSGRYYLMKAKNPPIGGSYGYLELYLPKGFNPQNASYGYATWRRFDKDEIYINKKYNSTWQGWVRQFPTYSEYLELKSKVDNLGG